jgi:glycerophosphoryl diester phosphodiesterase
MSGLRCRSPRNETSAGVRRRVLLGGLLLVMCWSTTVGEGKAQTMAVQEKSRKFDLSGHRGARGLCPENTIPAFAKALAIGVSSLEMDAAITKDKVVVISHDPFLDPNITRGPDGKWIEGPRKLIKDFTFAQLQQYDVGRIRPGTEHYERFGGQQVAVDRTRVPSLSAVIELVRKSGQREVVLSIEAKIDPSSPGDTLDPEGLAKALIEILRKEKFANRAYIQSFDWRVLQIVQRLAPEIPTVYLTSTQGSDDTLGIGKTERSKWTGDFNVNDYNGSAPHAIKAAGGRLWSPDSRDVDAAQVKTAHALGISVLPWTVNEAAKMAHFIDMGVDGIITDFPDRLRQVLKDKGMPLPKQAGGIGSRIGCKLRSLLRLRS